MRSSGMIRQGRRLFAQKNSHFHKWMAPSTQQKVLPTAASLFMGYHLYREFSTSTELLADQEVAEGVPELLTPATPEEGPQRFDGSQEIIELLRERIQSVEDFEITLYQYQVCPFCSKVRAFLDYNKIPYKMIEVNPLSKNEVKWSAYKKVPVCIINGIQLNDSVVIVSTLNKFLSELKNLPTQDTDYELQQRLWLDERFIRVLAPNIYRTYEEARQAFDYISSKGNFSYWQQQAIFFGGAFVMWGISSKLKKKYNIEDERKELYLCAEKWVEDLNGQLYHGGDAPDLADMEAYGMITSIEGLKAFDDMCQNTEFGPYFHRMKETIGESSGIRVDYLAPPPGAPQK